MMRVHILTLFPEMFGSFLRSALLGRALAGGLVDVRFTNPRDYAAGRHRSVDDTPYGGGSGMVMMPGPIVDALESLPGRPHRVLLSPQGRRFDQPTARRFAGLEALALVCGRYEGVDERVRDFVDEETSIGDFVLMGGEVAAMTIVEASVRLLPGVLGNASSPDDESHGAGALEYPQYTRPAEFRGTSVPEVLLSGNHAAVDAWRRGQSLLRTKRRRPDLFAELTLDEEDRRLLALAEAE